MEPEPAEQTEPEVTCRIQGSRLAIMSCVTTSKPEAAAAARIGARAGAAGAQSALLGAAEAVLRADAAVAAGGEVRQCAGQRACRSGTAGRSPSIAGDRAAGQDAAAAEPRLVG